MVSSRTPIKDLTGRILALDFGKRRIGLAVSDAMGMTAQGLQTLERTTIREDLAHLADIAATSPSLSS